MRLSVPVATPAHQKSTFRGQRRCCRSAGPDLPQPIERSDRVQKGFHRIQQAILQSVADVADNPQPNVRYPRHRHNFGRTVFQIRRLERVSNGIAVREVAPVEGSVETATCAPARFSVSFHTRPCRRGIRSSAKYPGPTRFIATVRRPSAGLPKSQDANPSRWSAESRYVRLPP